MTIFSGHASSSSNSSSSSSSSRSSKRRILLVFLTMLLKHLLAASTEEQMIADAINKHENEVNRRQEEFMNLLDRIVEEIEKCPEGR